MRRRSDYSRPLAPMLPRLSALKIKIDVQFSGEVIDESVAWVAASPNREVGGKLVGRIHGQLDRTRPDLLGQVTALRLDVIHHLDAGPAATRTATYHRPDGNYQEAVFRAIEARHPDVRHLGSWHSHHPNGLLRLSQGDIEGYTRDVNSPLHSHDLFLASLTADGRGLASAKHFLFIRGLNEYFQIDPRSVRIVQSYNSYSKIVRSCRQTASGVVDRRPAGPAATTDGARGVLWVVSWFWGLFLAALSRVARLEGNGNDDQSGGQSMNEASGGTGSAQAPAAARSPARGSLPGWTETKAGRDALSVDRAWISDDHPEFRLVSRSGTLLWTGVKEYDEMSLTVTFAYPDDYPATSPLVDITARSSSLDIKVQAILEPTSGGTPYRTQLFLLMRSVAKVGISK